MRSDDTWSVGAKENAVVGVNATDDSVLGKRFTRATTGNAARQLIPIKNDLRLSIR
jgi:hypothetical protein